MKKRIMSMLLVLAMVLGMIPAVLADEVPGEVVITEATFPDDHFRAFVSALPGAEDNKFSEEELAAIVRMDCNGRKLESDDKIRGLTGIAYFTSLEELDCSGNLITELDLSHNTGLKVLKCAQNTLESLNVAPLTALEELDCSFTGISALDLSRNSGLIHLNCSGNQLKSLHLESNPDLRDVDCSSNELTTLQFGENAKIKKLDCSSNSIGNLDLSKLTKLDELYCANAALTALDLSANLDLSYLDCKENKLTALDLSKNTELEYFYADGNSRNIQDQAVIADVMPQLDPTKTFDMTGGKFQDGKVVYDENSEQISYRYVCGNNQTMDVTLVKADESDPIVTTAAVTFVVVNGTWADNTIEPKVCEVSLSNGKGTLDAEQVPVDMIANEGYGKGSWDEEPATQENGITGDVTYTYTFVEYNPTISVAKVIFRVVNGTWDDKSADDRIVEVTLTDGVGTLPEDQVPTGMIANEGYGRGSWDEKPNTEENAIIGNVTYTYTFQETGYPTDPTVPEETTAPSEPEETTAPTEPEETTAPTEPEETTAPTEPTVPEVKKYTLTFDSNGGSAINSLTAEENTEINLEKYLPLREGYQFAGWFADAKLTQQVKSVKLTDNMTVYAKWNKIYKNPFTDVKESDYFYHPVLWAVDRKITKGMTPTTFGPEVNCTRAHAVTFLWSMAGKPEPKSTKNPFSDVKEADYYYKAVLWAVENGITGGMGDGKFGPNAICQRGQIVMFLWRFSGSPKASIANPFKDVKTSDYFYDAVLWAVEKGVTSGMGPNSFGPTSNCTRGQIVTFLWRTAGSPQ